MGALARQGISFGKRVPVSGLVPTGAHNRLEDDFVWRSLSYFGFGRIAEKIVAQADLSVDDVELLLSKASLPVLMKLVELRRGKESAVVLPQATVLVPLCEWLGGERGHANDVISHLDLYEKLTVILDGWRAKVSASAVLKAMERFRSYGDALDVMGPSLDDIVSSIVVEERQGAVTLSRIESVLQNLRSVGIKALLPYSGRGMLDILKRLDFVVWAETNLDVFRVPRSLAQELVRLNRDSGDDKLIDVWTPGVAPLRGEKRYADAALDLRVLRASAVGAITLKKISKIRASSFCLSNNAMRFSLQCGVNDLGFGAVDSYSAAHLHIERISILRDVLSGEIVAH